MDPTEIKRCQEVHEQLGARLYDLDGMDRFLDTATEIDSTENDKDSLIGEKF